MKKLVFNALDMIGLNRWYRRKHRGQIKVLLYHNVTEGAAHFDNALSPEQFGKQLEYLKKHYNIIGIDTDGAWRGLVPDRVNVLISFDDGFRNNLTHALPVLQKYNVPAVFFLIADCVENGAPPGFITARYGDDAKAAHFATLDRADVDTMLAAGMTIGSHSLAHANHADMDSDTMLAEARAARDSLEQRFGAPVANFAFPWGKHVAGQELAMLGVYERVFLTRHGFCDAHDRIIPRNEVTTLAHLKLAASGALDGLRALVKAG